MKERSIATTKKTRIHANKNQICTICGNTSWHEPEEEENRDFHYKITPSLHRMLAERKARLGLKWNGLFRAMIAGYDAYTAIQDRRQFADITVLKAVDGELRQEQL